MSKLRGDHWCNEASRLMRERDEARTEALALRAAAECALSALTEPGADSSNRREAADLLREALGLSVAVGASENIGILPGGYFARLLKGSKS